MAGNTVQINKRDELEWYVNDAEIEQVISMLNDIGLKYEETGLAIEEEKVIPLTDKEPSKMEMLDQWIKELVFPGEVKNFIQEDSGEGSSKEVTRRFYFYTDEHKYYIVAIERSVGRSYLGCQVSTRKPRAGEDWSRGNDLPDGDFTKETWNSIIEAVVRYELVKLSKYQKPDSIPDLNA